MPRFAYSAYDQTGDLRTGELQAATELAALDQLAARGLTPVALTEGGSALPWWQRDISLTGRAAAAKPEQMLLFFRTLASLLSVGFSLPRALRFCAETARHPAMRRALDAARDGVSDGQPLASAMRATEGYIPDRFLTMIEIGEAANRLPDVTLRIAETLEDEIRRRRELRGALVYPVILIAMSLLVLGLLVFYLAPTLMPVFASSSAPPPAILRAMTALRGALLESWPLMLGAVLALVLLLRLARDPLLRALAPLTLRLPAIGRYVQQSETLRLCRTLALMLSSGAPLPRALATAQETAGHPAYRALIERAQEAVTSGGTLSATLGQSRLVDPMSAAMLEAAEEADSMTPVLDRLAADLADRSARALDQAVKLITPVLTLAIGLGVGGVILSTINAILSLNDVAF